MEHSFNKPAFMDYMAKTFTGFENSFLRSLVENLIEHAVKHENTSKDQVVYFLSDMLPEVSFGEVAQFMDDDQLTAYGRLEKKDWTQAHKSSEDESDNDDEMLDCDGECVGCDCACADRIQLYQ